MKRGLAGVFGTFVDTKVQWKSCIKSSILVEYLGSGEKDRYCRHLNMMIEESPDSSKERDGAQAPGNRSLNSLPTCGV